MVYRFDPRTLEQLRRARDDREGDVSVNHSTGSSTDLVSRLMRPSEQARRHRVLRRSVWLRPRERRLLEWLWIEGKSAREIAALQGQNAGTVTRRLQRLIERLDTSLVAVCCGAAGRPGDLDRRLLLLSIVHRQSAASLAEQHDLRLREVTRRLTWMRGWVQGHLDAATMLRPVLQRGILIGRGDAEMPIESFKPVPMPAEQWRELAEYLAGLAAARDADDAGDAEANDE